MKTNTFLRIGLLLTTLPALAKTPPAAVAPPPSSALEFVANRHQWETPILFAANVPGGRLFLEHGRLVQVRYDAKRLGELHHQDPTHTKNKQRIQAHAYSTTFVGANPEAAVQGAAQLAGYNNYFLGKDSSHWASNVPGYGEVRYQGLYPGIDLRFYSKAQTLEYDFELAAGADAGRIALRYAGQSKLWVAQGALHIGTSVGTVVEQRPYAYQLVDGQRRRVACEYALGAGHTVRFALPEGYDHHLPLVIDPVLVYSSYTGSTAENYGFTATYDSLGNLYSGGTVFSAGYPATIGAYSMTFHGSEDIGIIKYNPNAATGATSRVYATYIGGNDEDFPHSLLVDHGNNLIIMGSSYSSNYPTTPGAYSRTLNSTVYATDIVLTKLNPAGSALVGSTYLGGSDSEGQNFSLATDQNYGDEYRGDVAVDRNGNIYIASGTYSTDFPTTNAAFQRTLGGNQDGIVSKLNPALTTLLWSTYLGGAGDESAYSIQLDSVNNVFVSGGTSSTNFPGTVGGLHSTYQGGTTDGFVARISPAGDVLVRSTYLGAAGYDQAYFVQLNRQGEVYAFGQTDGSYPVSAGVYSNAGSRQFIHKLNAQLTTSLFSTVIGNGPGTGPNMSPTAFLVDNCGQIMLSGWTGQANMPTTPDAIQRAIAANNFGYFYIGQLSANAQALTYGTYFGNGNCHVDGSTSRFDKKGVIYQAMCVGASGPIITTANAWSHTVGSGAGWNNAAFKMDVLKLNADFIPTTTATGTARRVELCAPAEFYFKRVAASGTNLLWNFGNGQTSTLATNPAISYPTPGKYPVRLTVYDSNSCAATSTTVDTVTVYAVPRPQISAIQPLCAGAAVTLTATNLTPNLPNVTYTWTAPGQPTRTGPSVQVSPTATVKYTVTVRLAGSTVSCAATDTVTVRVLSPQVLNAAFVPGLTAGSLVRTAGQCAPAQFYFTRPTVAGTNVSWDFGNGQTSTLANNATATYATPGKYAVRLTVVGSNACSPPATTVDTVTVYAVPRPQVAASSRQPVCIGTVTTLSATNLTPNMPGVTYTWTAPGQPTLTGASVTTPLTATARYVVTASAVAGAGGCSATDTVTVRVLNEPLDAHFIPALTPASTVRAAGQCAPAQFYFTRPAVVGTGVSWDFGNGQTSTIVNNATATYATPGKYPVRLTVMNTNGCLASQTTVDTVTVYAVPRPQIGAIQPICAGASATLSATNLTPNLPGVTYTWTAPGQPNRTGTSVQVSPTVTTRYTVTAVSAAGGCAGTDTVTVRVLPQQVLSAAFVPTLTVGSLVRTVGQCAPAQFYFTRPIVAGTTVSWDFGNGQTSTLANNATAAYSAPGKYAVRFTVLGANVCSPPVTTVDTVTVYAVPRPQVAAGSRQGVCPGNTATLMATNLTPNLSNVTYTWTAPGQPARTGASVTVSPLATTRYTVTAISAAGGCVGTDTVTVRVFDPLVASAGPMRTICAGASTTLSAGDAGPGASYTWTALGQPTLTGRIVTVSPPGSLDYRVQVRTATGCQASASVRVEVAGEPRLSFAVSSPNLVNQPVAFQNTSTGATSYRWSFGDGTSSTEPNPSHVYTTAPALPFHVRLTATYGPGCEASTELEVPVHSFDLPNVITPNHDGQNDTFRPFVTTERVDIQIFNRWGRLVFEQKGYANDWSGDEAPAGVYYYRLVSASGANWKGWVEVVK